MYIFDYAIACNKYYNLERDRMVLGVFYRDLQQAWYVTEWYSGYFTVICSMAGTCEYKSPWRLNIIGLKPFPETSALQGQLDPVLSPVNSFFSTC